jgi:hypothetical protein
LSVAGIITIATVQRPKLRTALADAIAAERVAAGEAAALRAELDALRKRHRRWFRW